MKYLVIDEIKQLFEYVDSRDWESISKILKEPSLNVDMGEMKDEELKEFEKNLFKLISSRVDEKDYEKLLEDEEIDQFELGCIIFSTNNSELMKRYIEKDRYERGVNTLSVIKRMKDEAFTKECIKNPIYEWTILEKTRLLREIKDSELIKEFILENLEILKPWDIADLISATNEIEEYLDKPAILENLNSWDILDLIRATNEIEEWLDKPAILEKLEPWDIADLIMATNEIEEYLDKPAILERLYGECLSSLIIRTSKIVKYLERTEVLERLDAPWLIADLIKESTEIEKFLGKTEILQWLDSRSITDLIRETNEIDKYLEKTEILEKLNRNCKVELIKDANEMGKYLTKEKIEELKLQNEDIAEILGLKRQMIPKIPQLIEDGKIENFGRIFRELSNTNSNRLNKVKQQISLQLCEINSKNIKSEVQQIKNIYETTDLPEFAQNFLVFKTLHPEFMGDENILNKDVSSASQIPSLEEATPEQRNRIIFSDLLKINIESNNRNLKSYLKVIEQGDKLFGLVKEGKLQINKDMPEKYIETLTKYRDILNTLYNQTSKGKRAEVKRKNTGDIEKDLLNLDKLLSSDVNGNINLPDRIVRMFGHSIGIRTFEQAKQVMEEVVKETNERNQKNAKKCNITLKEGDFVKGISSDFLPQMLQTGIVARDYLGQDADYDLTPGDTDVEMIKETDRTFRRTYYKLKTAPRYAKNGKLGDVLLVFGNNDSFINTRTDRRC